MIRYFEDFAVGSVEHCGTHVVLRADVLDFASKYDPQSYHLDDEAAANSLFGRLSASGWHTAAMTMRNMVDHWKATGATESSLCGVGTDEMRWLKPVYPDDVLRFESEVLEKKELRSKPDTGLVKAHWRVFNQEDEPVYTVKVLAMFRRRPSGEAAV